MYLLYGDNSMHNNADERERGNQLGSPGTCAHGRDHQDKPSPFVLPRRVAQMSRTRAAQGQDLFRRDHLPCCL